MRRVLGPLFFIALVTAIGFATVAPPNVRAADPPTVIDQREIEIPKTRIVGISPDGTAIAATSWNYDELCVYDIETLAERACANLDPLRARLRIADVVWSPDSSKLALAEEAFIYFRDGDLWIMDAFTGELTDLTDEGYEGDIPLLSPDEVPVDEIYIDVSPTWLPDGSGITFSRSTWRQGELGGNAIYTVPVTGGAPELETVVTLDTPGVVYFGMRWTTDQSALYYAVNHPDSGDPLNGIWRVNADGLDASKVVEPDPDLGAPVLAGLSPDGTTILAHYAMAASQFGFEGSHLYALVDVPAGTVTPLTIQAGDAGVAWPAVLSPDGQYIAYVARASDPAFRLYISPVDGGGETVLLPEGLPNGGVPVDLTAPLTWSGDGTLVLGTTLLSTATLITIDTGTATTTPATAATPVPTATMESTPRAGEAATGLALGTAVTVNDNDVPLRDSAGVAAPTVVTLSLGTKLRVLGEPVDVDGFTWVPVADLSTNTVGYVRIEFITIAED